MMWMMKTMIKKNKIEDVDKEEYQEFMETYGKIVDFTNRENISDLTTYCVLGKAVSKWIPN